MEFVNEFFKYGGVNASVLMLMIFLFVVLILLPLLNPSKYLNSRFMFYFLNLIFLEAQIVFFVSRIMSDIDLALYESSSGENVHKSLDVSFYAISDAWYTLLNILAVPLTILGAYLLDKKASKAIQTLKE